MQEQYNFPVKMRILDREYKHVLTWQQNGAKTGFEIVTVEPPVHVPDPNPSLSPVSALAQSPDQSPDQSPEGTSGGPLRWVVAVVKRVAGIV